MLSYCIKNQIVIQAYSPLTRTQRLNDPMLLKIAAQYGKTSAQLLLRWNLQRGTVPLPKANQLGHQKENLAVFDFEITDKDMEALNQLNEKYSSLGSLPYI
jgi:2,5-diketo-D-gluconate reductase A